MFSIKCSIAAILLLQTLASASAFMPPSNGAATSSGRAVLPPPPASTTASPPSTHPRIVAGDTRNTRRYANQKLTDQSIKPADLSKSGLGGFDVIARANKKMMEGYAQQPANASKKVGVVVSARKAPPPKVVVAKNVPTKVAAKSPPPKKVAASVVVGKKNVGKVIKGVKNDDAASDPTKTPWSTILVSFLIPWRNPNSIFLYLLLVVSVLGKLNEHPQ